MLTLLAGAVGYLAGAFTPAVGRKIKAAFVSKSQAVQPKLLAEAKAVAVDAVVEAKKV